jgi:hypothetical protein
MTQRALSLALLATALLVSPAFAQRSGGFATAPASRTTTPIGTALPRGGPVRSHIVRMHRGRHLYSNSLYGPGYSPYYDSEDTADQGVEPPQRIILQSASPAAPAPAPTFAQSKPAEPLVMELRGDHWVRLTPSGPQEVSNPSAPRSDQEQLPVFTASSSERPALPPAVLVFRDGHQEEAAQYTIIGKTISIKSDYWTTGSWTRTVQISALDLPATLQANQARGSNFRLPSRPTEVILR